MAISTYAHEGSVLAAAAALQGAVVGANTKRVIISAALVNTTAGALPATLHLVPSGATAADSNCLVKNRVLAAGETYLCPELINQVINAGGAVYGLGAGVTFRYSARDLVGG